ncbi:MAG: hypothetical protein Q4C83_02425, partial [Candidatus Saccharibacteria bacterium]|nr:hypothetical protein [Candidatus Saccharibacteria bacterium]
MTEHRGNAFWRWDQSSEIVVEAHFNTKVATDGDDFAHANGPGQALLLELIGGVIAQLEGNGSLRRNDDFLRVELEDSGVMKIELLSKSGDWPHVVKVLASLFKRARHRLLTGWNDQVQFRQVIDRAAEKSRQRLLREGDLSYFARQAIRVGNYIPRRREVRAITYDEARVYISAVLSVFNCRTGIMVPQDNESILPLITNRQIIDDLWTHALEPYLTTTKVRYNTVWTCV